MRYDTYHPPITVTAIVSFILRHRGVSNAFKEWPVDDIKDIVCDGIHNGCIVVDSDFCGFIQGVIVAELDSDNRRLHVVGIIATTSGCLAKFSSWLLRQRDKEGFNITAHRRDKLVNYNTSKLLTKLISRYGQP